ncbi:MAG: CAAX prenyl protease-related protein [Pirellulaceae bacterium]
MSTSEQLTDGQTVSSWDYWLARHHWLPYVLPFAVYMLVGSCEPRRPSSDPQDPVAVSAAEAMQNRIPGSLDKPPQGWGHLGYPVIYIIQIGATLLAMLLVRSVYQSVPLRLSLHAAVYGIVGGLLWIVVCRAGLEQWLWTVIGHADWADYAARPSFNPLATFEGSPVGLGIFLTLRFAGLVVIVPIIEEFFLRGFLMRFFVTAQWWTIPLGTVTLASASIATIYGVLSHPAEWIAALLWFSLITLLYSRTRNLWDCVAAHAVTNGILGVYIVLWQDWTLW